MHYLENLTEIDYEYLAHGDWDVIKMNLQLNPVKLKEYLDIITTKYADLRFDFEEHAELLNDYTRERYAKENRVTNYVGKISGWTLSWPVERDCPIPSQVHVDKSKFPELEQYNLYDDSKLMERYNCGYMTTLNDKLTVRALRQLILTKHPQGLTTLTHVDGARKKLHIPLQTNPNAIFHFGPNGEREYNFEVGSMYLINPAIPHGTYNTGDEDRYHLISRVDFAYFNDFLKMTGVLD